MCAKLRLDLGPIGITRASCRVQLLALPLILLAAWDGCAKKTPKSWLEAKPLLHRAARVRGTSRKWRGIDEWLADTHHTGTTGY